MLGKIGDSAEEEAARSLKDARASGKKAIAK